MNDEINLEFNNDYTIELDMMETLIKKEYPHLTMEQMTDIGERPIGICIETTNKDTFIDDLNIIFKKTIG